MIKENIMAKIILKEGVFSYAMKFTLLFGISIAAPFLHFQALTGTIVNAVLFITVVILGRKEAIMIGIFPSLISITTGLLLPAVIPLIPFIVLGNAILIFIFSFIREENYWKGVVAGSLLKFGFLYLAGIVSAQLFFGKEFAKIALTMFSWQQLLTALSGGVVAYATLKILKKI
jgi:hypothetical protein